MNQDYNNFNQNNADNINNNMNNNQQLNPAPQQFQNNYNDINQNNTFSQINNVESQPQQVTPNGYQQTIVQYQNLNQSHEGTEKPAPHKSNKKNGLIIGIVIAIVAIIVAVFIINLNSGKSGGIIGTNNAKEQTYLNDNKNITDKISFIINHTNNNKNNVFLGFSMTGIAKSLTADVTSLNNDTTRLESAGSKITFYYNNTYYGLDTEVESYDTKNNKTSEYIDDQNVVYKDNNYYVTNSSIGKYILYYKYDESLWNGFRDNETHATWYLLSLGFYDSVEDAKTKINEYSNNLYICTYTDDESISKCNYKSYRYVDDLIMDMLNRYDLYVDSYNQVVLSHGDVTVVNNDNEFTISFQSGSYNNFDGYTNFKLNDSDFYLKDRAIIHNANNVKIGIYTSLSYNVENTDENIISEFKNTFKK